MRQNLKFHLDDAHNVHITEISFEKQCLNSNGDDVDANFANRRAYNNKVNRSYRPYDILTPPFPLKKKRGRKNMFQQ